MLEQLLNKWLSREELLLALAMETPPRDPKVAEKLEGQLRRSLRPLEELEGGEAFIALVLDWCLGGDRSALEALEREEFAHLRQRFEAIVRWEK